VSKMRSSIKISYILIAFLLLIGSLVEISNPANAQEPEYYLSVNIIGSGIVTVNGSSPYLAGSVVVMTAYPSTDWEFTGWSGDLSGSINPEYLTMDSNKSVTVTFTEIPEYYLSVNIIGSGIVTVNGSSPYLAGSVVNMTAYANLGWEFTGWSGDLTGTNNPEYLTMDSNKTVTATFEMPVGGTVGSVNRVYLLFAHAWPIIIGVAGLIAGVYLVSQRRKRLDYVYA
jgi:uncharacterized repeat protein (TIGR02543 family)